MSNLRQKIEEIVENCSKPGWDSYGATPVDRRSLEAAVSFLEHAWLGPSNDGGACLEESGGELEFIIEFRPDGLLDGVYFKSGDWEFEVERPE